MVQIKEMSETVPLGQQMAGEEGPIVLINVFTVDPKDADALLTAWAHDAEFMKAQPGYISTQLHQGIAGSSAYVNYAIWDSVEDFRNAFGHPEFQSRVEAYPPSVIASPHLFKKLAVKGHCTA